MAVSAKLPYATETTGVEASYRPLPDRTRLASVTPQWSTDLAAWSEVPGDRLATVADGRVTVRFQPGTDHSFLRLQVAFRVVQ